MDADRGNETGAAGAGDIVLSERVAVIRSANLVVLDGPRDLVDRLVAQDPVLCARTPRPVQGAGATAALTQLAAAVGTSGSHQALFQLDEVGLSLFQNRTLASAADGGFRLFGKAPDGAITAHGALTPIAGSSTRMLSAQLALMTLALTAAIKDVQAAVERVESQVAVLRDLLESQRVGEIIGFHERLVRRTDAVGLAGTVSTADWNGMDDEGYGTENILTSLRSFIRKRLRAAVEEGERIGGRVDALEHVRELSETLALLIVAEDNLFLFQQLRLIRIRDTEPERLEAAILEVKVLMTVHARQDQDVLDAIRELLEERVGVDALEIHRFVAARSVGTLAAEVDEMLTWFAGARSLHYERVTIPPVPGVGDAIDEIRERSGEAVEGTRRAFGSVAGRVRQRALTRGEPDRSAIEAGDELAQLIAGKEVPRSSEPDQERRKSRVRGALSRVRPRRTDDGPDEDEGSPDQSGS